MPTRTLQIAPGFAARQDGRPVAFARRGADRLLVYLALSGPTLRRKVAETLWPDVDHERALASLRQAVRAVHVAGGDGWVEADRAVLRLASAVEVLAGAPLLKDWDDAWLDAHRRAPAPKPVSEPPFDALFGLIGWYRDRAPETAVLVATEALSIVQTAPPARLAREMGPIFARLERIPTGAQDLCEWVARAYYLQGDMERAYSLYGRMAHELGAGNAHAALARLSQVVILRESGQVRAAARLAEEAMSRRPRTPYGEWNTRYHLGYSRHLAGEADGLDMARAAVESGMADAGNLTRIFPLLNVAEALLDAGDPAAYRLLREGAALAPTTGDDLAMLTAETLENLWLARTEPDAALERLKGLERRAWEARLAPFVASLVDRAALLAHRIGRYDEAARLLKRGERVRKRLRLRRVPVERARILALL